MTEVESALAKRKRTEAETLATFQEEIPFFIHASEVASL